MTGCFPNLATDKMLDTRSSANPKKEKYQKKNAYLILWKVHIKIKS